MFLGVSNQKLPRRALTRLRYLKTLEKNKLDPGIELGISRFKTYIGLSLAGEGASIFFHHELLLRTQRSI